MKIEKVEVVCAVCGAKVEVNKVLSYSTRSAPDLDLRYPYMDVALGIEECPHCHYCSYDISKMEASDYPNELNKDRWINDEEVKDIVEKCGDNVTLRKCLIMAYRAKCNIKSEQQYRMLLKASWVTEGSDIGKELKTKAVEVYMEEIGEGNLSELLSFADVARMAGEFDVAKAFAKAAKELSVLSDDDGFLSRVCDYELTLIDRQDIARHSTSEVDGEE